MHHSSWPESLSQHSFGFTSTDGLDDGCGTSLVAPLVGAADGLELATTEGLSDGWSEGIEVAIVDGEADGLELAATEGLGDGWTEGLKEASPVGGSDAARLGSALGDTDGDPVGALVAVGSDGALLLVG
jgi:hypothetical protein